MKAPIYYRRFNYDKVLIPNKYLASLEDGVCTIEEAKTKTGFTIGYPGWNLVYDMVLSHLHPEKYNIILETGTNVGCTTIMLAQALKDSGCHGKVYTVELDKKSHEIALTNLEKAGVSDFVEAVNASSHDFLKDFVKINSSIRIAFLDASHLFDDVVAEFEAILPSLGPESLVIFDNTYQIADENEDQRVNGAIREILKRHGGNLVNFEIVSWYTPGLAIWQKSPFDCVDHQYDKGKIACAVETQGKDRILGLYSQAHNLAIGGNYAQALELYDRIIADVPALMSKTPQINYERALCLKALGRIHDAEQAIRSSLSVKPDDAECLRFLSEIQFAIGGDIGPSRESKVKPEPANVKQAEEADRLYSEVKTLLPLVQQTDIIRGLRAISSIEEQIVGRACGRVRNKLLNYLSIVQFARATGSKTVDSIEIGTLFGGSCLMKLFAMRDLGVEGKVVCIDPMSGFYDQTRDPQTGLAVTAEVFFENIERFGFTKEAVDLRDVKSNDPRATEGLRERSFATLLIDGDHSYRGVRYDWENYYRFVQPGGIVLFDDYSEPKWPDITVFASELIDFLPDGWRKLGHLGTTLLFSRQPRRTKQVSQEPHDPKPAQTKFLARAGALKKEENLLAILDPEVISRRSDLINELARYGIDHLTKSPALGWNYVLDHVWITEEIECYLSENPRRDLTVLDVGCGRSKFHDFLEKKFGINIIGIDRPQGYCHQAKLENTDYYADFLELDVFGENSVDIIFWLSAIEHNEKGEIRQLFQKSMSLLKEGGLFLATFAISKNTHWFGRSEQTNLSVEDSMHVFEEAKVDGNFDEIREKYRKNLLFLRDKYEKRYERFAGSDPDFVVGAVKKIKAASCVEDSSSPTIAGEQTCRYLFMPSNDTHVDWMYPLAQALEQAAFMVIPAKNERAEYYLTTLKEQFFIYQAGLLRKIRPGVIVFGCDWGGHERKVIQEAKDLGIPTVCIQEGCLDFMDKRANRMMYADYAFLQGPIMRRYFRKTDNVVVTGNPKYDRLKETPLPQNVTVMINCNFTYRIFENVREQWIRDVAESCKELGLNFFISQHPRDKGVFPAGYPVVRSEAFKLKEQLERTSILVSRFSTVIYEASMMGREAVYYNPHGEPFRIFAEDHTGGIKTANSRSELVAALKSAVADLGRNKEKRQEFLRQHCGTLGHDATEKCARELQAIARRQASSSPFATARRNEDDGQSAEEKDRDAPSVSVIIPCYNGGKYLGQAIESVLIQNYRNFELIIIDDGSTDATRDIIGSFKDERIRYFYQANSGLAAAHNAGIKNSKGVFIIKLDADDMMTPEFIARHLMEFEEHPEADLVYCDDRLVGEDTKPIRVIERPEYADRKLLIRDLFRCGFPVVPFRTCIRKSVFEKIGFFDEGLRMAEDYDMMRRFVKAGLKAHHLKGALYIRRMTADSLSRNFTLENAKFHFDVVKRFMDTFRYDELFPDVAWERIPAEHRQSHAKCLAAVTFLGIGQAYVKTNSVNYARTAFDLACSELNSCLEMDPGNVRVRQLLNKSEFARSRCLESAPQAAC